MTFQAQAEQLLRRIKSGEPTRPMESALAGLDFDELRYGLKTDQERKAFWINIYNAYYLLLRQLEWDRPLVFKMKLVPLAGKRFSLDEIEHGILRRCRVKWAAGFLPSPFYRPPIYQLMLKRSDCRVHFALNCGATSCPPIAFYSTDRLEEQLDMATYSFLEQETRIDQGAAYAARQSVAALVCGRLRRLPRLAPTAYKTLDLEPLSWRLRFRPYDWTERLYNFQD